MSTNAHNLPAPIPITVDRSPARSNGSRSKGGLATAFRPIHGTSSEVAKVALSDICLSYSAERGQRLRFAGRQPGDLALLDLGGGDLDQLVRS